MSRGTYLFLPGTSKDVLLSCSMLVKGGDGGGVPRSLRFLSIFKIKVKLPLPSPVTQNAEVAGNCLLGNRRSKYDLGGKFGDEVNRAINPHQSSRGNNPKTVILLEGHPASAGKQSWKFISNRLSHLGRTPAETRKENQSVLIFR